MALATRCPACSTVFRISTAQAAAKGGMVRCGQCRNVFNSLDALVRVEDLEVIDEGQVDVHGDTAVEQAVGAAPRAEDVPTESPVEAVEPMASTPGPDIASVPDTADERPAEDAFAATRLDPIDRPTAGEWWLPDPAEIESTPPTTPPTSGPATTTTTTTGSRDDAGRLLSGRLDLQPTGVGTGPTFLHADAKPARPGRAARWILGLLSLVAAAGLVAQLAYQWRDELAVRWPPARRLLTAACLPLGCKVGYPMHLEAITIESATIQTSGANLDVYTLNALLRNRGSVDVRYPYLELVLTDLQDRPILRRALRPEDYLPAGRDSGRDAARNADGASQAGFPAESELPIHVLFELGDLRFAGYRLDKFYP